MINKGLFFIGALYKKTYKDTDECHYAGCWKQAKNAETTEIKTHTDLMFGIILTQAANFFSRRPLEMI